MKIIYIGLFSMLLFVSCESNQANTQLADKPKETVQTSEEKKIISTEKVMPCATSLDVYLNDPDVTGTNLRDKPKGNILGKLVKEDEESAFFITVTESDNGWFKISKVEDMESLIELDYSSLWIHGSVLGVNTKNYGGEVVTVYDEPNNKSKEVAGFKEETYGLILLDVCGDWVEVKKNDIQGWVNKKWLCGSPITTCS